MKRPLIALVVAASLLTLNLGCAENQNRPTFSPNGDIDIISHFRIEMNKHPEINAHNLDVDSHNGTFTLSGIVNTPQDRNALLRIAHRLKGVREVIDNLIVRQDSSP